MKRVSRALGLAVSLAALEARAAEPVRLEYVAAPDSGCGDEAEFITHVKGRPERISWSASATVVARVELRRNGARWHGVFESRGTPSPTKPFTYESSTSCEEIASRAAADLALSLGKLGPVTPNKPPVANDDAYRTERHAKLVVGGRGVLENDLDSDSPATVLRVIMVSSPKGSLVLSSSGTFTYTPELMFAGEDSFTYRVLDESRYSELATVRIEVTPDPRAAPYIGTVEPSEVEIGETVWVEVHGRDLPEKPVVTFDGDVLAAADTKLESTGLLRVQVVASVTTSFGPWTMYVRDATDPARVATAALKITDLRPRIESISPESVEPGRDVELEIKGLHFRQDAAAVIASAQIAVHRTVVVDSRKLLVAISVRGDAPDEISSLVVDNVAGLSRSSTRELRIETKPPPPPPRAPMLSVFAGSEGGYSYWSGGTDGPDQHYQSSAISGDLVAGGDRALAGGYGLDVLIAGYGATKRDRRSHPRFETWGRNGKPKEEYVTETISATALRAALHSEAADTGVSLGLLVGGFQETGCRHDRTGVRNWSTPLCGDFQQWAVFPTFSLRLGPMAGPYATLGFLDGRTLAGSLGHLGVGKVLPGDARLEIAAVAATEGIGPRVSMVVPFRRRWVLMPSASGGILYDAFVGADGRNSSWFRGGLVVGMVQGAENVGESGKR